MRSLSVVLVGAHGYGARHLANILRLQAAGVVRLVGICSRSTLGSDHAPALNEVPVSFSLTDLLRRTSPDVTVIATPPHTHVDLACAAMRAGSHVLLEKPPATTLRGFHELQATAADTGVLCQVGFQSFGSRALQRLSELHERGDLGATKGIGGVCAAVRDASYFGRSSWAGRRRLDGQDVADGALTNTFAHAIAAALRVDGSDTLGSVESIEPGLYRANEIETDDTSCLRLQTARGTTILIAATLCAAEDTQPYLVVDGTAGRATLTYQRGELRVERDGQTEIVDDTLDDLLHNLVRVITVPGTELISPLVRTGAFTEVLEAIRTAPGPAVIPPAAVRVVGQGLTERRMVAGIDDLIHRATADMAMYSELGVSWATAPS